MSRETKRLVGKKLPMLGTPLVMLGITDNKENKVLDVEIHLFFEGIFKSYTPRPFEWAYGDDDPKTNEIIHQITTQWVNDEIEQMIIDAMEANKIPVEFYRSEIAKEPGKFFLEVEKPDFFGHVLGLWARGKYTEEVRQLAQDSQCFRSEFAEAMRFSQKKLTLTRA